MAAIFGISSRYGLAIEVCHRIQPNKSKILLYNLLLIVDKTVVHK